jgi:ketosteroid isomerase-like protein
VRVRTVIFVFFLALPSLARPAAGQEAEVQQAVAETLDSWRTGDFARFAIFYHPDTRGFFLDGGMLVEGLNLAALEAAYNAGFRADLDLGEVNVRVQGDVALTVALLEGSLAMPGGGSTQGSWRYSDTRILEEGTWKIVQYHFSEMVGPTGR